MLPCRLVLIVVLWLAAVVGAAAHGLPAGASQAVLSAGLSFEPAIGATSDTGTVAPHPEPDRSDFDTGGLRADESKPLAAQAPGCCPLQLAVRPAQPPWPERLWRPPSAAPASAR